MSLFQKNFNASGQSLIEYAVILILVMAGIIIGGPYVIRGWNANIKGWEDSIEVSIDDPMLEATPDSITPPDCIISPWTDQGCGPMGGCAPTQIYQTRIIVTPGPLCGSGMGYNDLNRCVSDMRCCIPGSPPVYPPNIPNMCGCGQPMPPSNCWLSDCDGAICQLNEVCMDELCSDALIPRMRCQADANCYTCTGTLPPPAKGQLCPGDNVGLSGFTAYTPVANCSVPAGSAPKCEVDCIEPNFPNAGTCNTCGPGKVFKGSCPGPDQCETGLLTCNSSQCVS